METNNPCARWRSSILAVRKDFPGGREWKLPSSSENKSPPLGPKGLSRWKGMETHIMLMMHHINTISPKGLSRWKGMETVCLPSESFAVGRPKGLSRWKGIETLCHRWSLLSWSRVRKDFPGGREWKRAPLAPDAPPLSESERTFPVEGNGNNASHNLVPAPRSPSERTFPVEGNGNTLPLRVSVTSVVAESERTFPVEGNGNLKLLSILTTNTGGPKGLSRWKGMETVVPPK